MQIISGSSNPRLAEDIAKHSGYEILPTRISKFNSSELKIAIHGNVKKEVAIIQSTPHPVNDHIIELLLLTDTVKKAGAKEIIAIVPYLGYSRQDRNDDIHNSHSPVSANLVANLLETTGITKLITLDLHSKTVEKFFNIPVTNLEAVNIFSSHFHHTNQKTYESILVAPDEGSVDRTHSFNSLFNNKEIVTMKKTRIYNNDETSNCIMQQISGNINGKNCIIIDDIVDSAETLCKTADLLKANGAFNIEAYVTHAVLSDPAIERLMKSPISKIIVSNSIHHPSLPGKFTTIDVAKLLAFALSSINDTY